MNRAALVATANYFFPGLGYVLLGKRTVFGWALMFAVAVQALQILIDPLPYIVVYGSTAFSVVLGFSAIFLFQVAFAYDAYRLATES